MRGGNLTKQVDCHPMQEYGYFGKSLARIMDFILAHSQVRSQVCSQVHSQVHSQALIPSLIPRITPRFILRLLFQTRYIAKLRKPCISHMSIINCRQTYICVWDISRGQRSRTSDYKYGRGQILYIPTDSINKQLVGQ